jgi:hypothetical protein
MVSAERLERFLAETELLRWLDWFLLHIASIVGSCTQPSSNEWQSHSRSSPYDQPGGLGATAAAAHIPALV